MIVCGGGMSLLKDIKALPDLPKISANHHAAQIFDCEIVVYYNEVVPDLLKHYPAKLVDIRETGIPLFGYTGISAVAYALSITDGQVYLAGFGLYRDGYCTSQILPRGGRRPLENHFIWWDKMLDYVGDDRYRIFPVSGPLCER